MKTRCVGFSSTLEKIINSATVTKLLLSVHSISFLRDIAQKEIHLLFPELLV